MEVRRGILHRWEPTSPEYVETMKYMTMRKYHRALDDLQRLVIQRLFELHRLNVGRTGKDSPYFWFVSDHSATAYRMRTHIAKSLQARCKAIRNAVDKYNAAAAALSPPRQAVDWSRVSHYGFLEEFGLLRGTRQDVIDKPWSQPAVRETMKQHLRIKRAREEITACNVQIRRLQTSIHDEDLFFDSVLLKL
jgi:hypothetical protein